MDVVIKTLSCLIAQAQYLHQFGEHEVEILLFGRLDFQLARAATIVVRWCTSCILTLGEKLGVKAEAVCVARNRPRLLQNRYQVPGPCRDDATAHCRDNATSTGTNTKADPVFCYDYIGY